MCPFRVGGLLDLRYCWINVSQEPLIQTTSQSLDWITTTNTLKLKLGDHSLGRTTAAEKEGNTAQNGSGLIIILLMHIIILSFCLFI